MLRDRYNKGFGLGRAFAPPFFDESIPSKSKGVAKEKPKFSTARSAKFRNHIRALWHAVRGTCARLAGMTTEFTEQEIDRLHEKLAVIYRRGALTAGERVSVQGLWARIERLESSRLAIVAREEGRSA